MSTANPLLSAEHRTEAELDLHDHLQPVISKPVHQEPVRLREVVVLLLLVALCDVTIYRSHGFAGFALLLAGAPLLLLLGTPRPVLRAGVWVTAGMLLLLAMRMVWLGAALGVFVG